MSDAEIEIGNEVMLWIRREKQRAETCDVQIKRLEEQREKSLWRVRLLEKMLDASNFLNAKPDEVPF